METKVCTKCGVEYPATREWFHAKKSGKYGLKSSCKDCYKKYYENNAERIIERNKKYYENNTERRRERDKKYYENNTERIRERTIKYREKNIEIVREREKKYYENNIERIREYAKNNPEKVQYIRTKNRLKKQIGATPPPELVEIKVLITKTKKLCKTLNN